MRSSNKSEYGIYINKSLEELGVNEIHYEDNVTKKGKQIIFQKARVMIKSVLSLTVPIAIAAFLFNGGLLQAIQHVKNIVDDSTSHIYKRDEDTRKDISETDESGGYFIRGVEATDGTYNFSMIKNKQGYITGFSYKQQ